jgi:pyruvate ferredoxin oxidoreductase gamma subunit
MFQMRFHGRGGQGVVTAAEMLSLAAFIEEKHAQAFPSFGSERMGAPVVSFCRISATQIRLRDPIYEPDALIIQDPTLLSAPEIFDGLKPSGFVLINSGKNLSELALPDHVRALPKGHLLAIPATDLALEHIGRPLPNAIMLGGMAALSGVVDIDSIIKAINETFPGKIAKMNVAAANAAYRLVDTQKNNSYANNNKEGEAIAC